MASSIVKIFVTTPASIANLGAGFDCLALALDLKNEFTLYVDQRGLVEGTEKEFEIDLNGRYKDVDPKMLTASGNLFVHSFDETRKILCRRYGRIVPKCPIMACEDVRIPPMRGLGSSSSACVAGVIAAIHFLKVIDELPLDEVLDDTDWCASLAMETDTCPDNICACLSGGLTYSFKPEPQLKGDDSLPKLHYFREEINDPDIRVIALVPNKLIPTPQARQVTEAQIYKIADAVFNISRSTCIPTVFREKRYDLLGEVIKDRIHQKQRAEKFFVDEDERKAMDLQHIFDQVRRAGAYGACISGAGSTLVAFVHASKAQSVKHVFRTAFDEVAKLGWEIKEVLVLTPRNERTRATVTKEQRESLPDSVSAWLDRAPGWRPIVKGSNQPGSEDKSTPEPDDKPGHVWPPNYQGRRRK